MKKNLKVNGKINIESVDDRMSIEVKGNGFSILNLLTVLSNQLIKQTGLDEEDILFAIKLGFKNVDEDDEEDLMPVFEEEEENKESKQANNEVAEKIFELLKNTLLEE